MANDKPPPSELVQPPRNDEEQDPKLRAKKQLTIALAGVGFIILSTAITRRGVNRRIKWAKPTYFRQNMHHPEEKINGKLEAMEALHVATVNVISWSIFFGGGVMYATNTSGLNEMRSKLRVRLQLTEQEQKDSQVQVAEWFDAVKPWNAFKQEKPESSNPKAAESKEATHLNSSDTSQS